MMKISMRPLFDQTFKQQDGTTPGPEPPLQAADSGVPMFTMEDVRSAPGLLDKLLRGIFIKQHITKEIFDYRFRNYALNNLGLHSTSLNSTKGNTLKAINRGRISPLIFRRALMAMGYKLCDMTVDLRTDQGETVVISIKDIMSMVDDDTHEDENANTTMS